jgi:hypothetical protein
MARIQDGKPGEVMPRTRRFSDTVEETLRKSPMYRRALLREAVGCLVTGEIEVGKIVLTDYINGTIGFAALGKAMGHSPASLMRMLGPKGNPPIRRFLEVTTYLQKIHRALFEVVDKKAA